MTVTQSYSLSLTYTSLRVYLPQTAPASVPPSSESMPGPASGDTVTLSPEATAPQAAEEPPVSAPPEGSVSSPDEPPAPTSRAARRAEVLLDALDADQDDAVTKEEFLEGAMALLRRAGARHHHRHHHRVDEEGDQRHDHEGRGVRRLERKLDRLFERVDDSGDGNVDQAELTDALMKVTRERRPDTTEPPAPSAQEAPAPPAAALLYTNVTVTIAVKQYASVAAMTA